MRCERIGKRTDRLNWRRHWRPFDTGRGGLSRIFLDLLPQRGHFEPRTRRHHQHFERRRIEHALGSAICVKQRGDFFFEYQRQNQDLLVLRSTELSYESLIHFSDVRWSYYPILIRMGHRPSAHVEGEILDRVVVSKPASLPATSCSSFHHEESDARRIRTARIEQCSQNFFLSGPCVNTGNRLRERARRRACGR